LILLKEVKTENMLFYSLQYCSL